MLDLILALFAAYVILLLFLRAFESRFIFFPNYPNRLAGDWQPRGLPVEDTWLQTADGVRLHAWWIPAAGAQFTFIAFHGNASNVANRAEVFRLLHGLPANVFAVEYRGYGHSEGTPSEAGIYLDAQAAYDYVTKQRGVMPRRIIAFGQSLGTAAAADLAAKREVGGVILEAPFPSARAMARRVYWFLPGLGWVAKSKFDTTGKLSGVRVPILIVHCTRDAIIGFALGEEVFARAHEPKFLWRVEGECHEEASLVAPEKYRVRLREFLTFLAGQK